MYPGGDVHVADGIGIITEPGSPRCPLFNAGDAKRLIHIFNTGIGPTLTRFRRRGWKEKTIQLQARMRESKGKNTTHSLVTPFEMFQASTTGP
jgi:hypothetical protein